MTTDATNGPWARARTVSDWLALRLAETPDACAFRHETAHGQWHDTTWREFGNRVAALRRGLAGLGLRKGERLALILPVGLEWELLHHAALASGLVVVGLDAHDLPARLVDMAAQAQVTAFAVADAGLWQRMRQAGGASLGEPWLILTGTAHEGRVGERCRSLEDLETSAHAAPAEGPRAEDMATVIFTSGTTGAPKGIAYSHAQLCLAIDAIADAFNFAGIGSHLLCWLPLSNLFQRVVNLAGLRQGATTYLLSDPRRVMEVVAGVEPDVFVGVPRFYEKLHEGIQASIAAQPALRRRLACWALAQGRRVSRLRRAGRTVPLRLALAHWAADTMVLQRIRAVMGRRLRCMVTGSAPMPRHLLEEFHAIGWLVLEAYGLSENVLPMALNRLDDFRFGTVGKPLEQNEIRLGDDGQVFVRGPGVFGGYLGEARSASIDREGWMATGDLAAFDSDGFLRLLGRSNDIIKTSTGRRIAPTVAEELLRQVPGIDQAILLGAGRKGPVALCTVAAQAPDAELRTRLQEQVLRINEADRPMAVGLLKAPFSIEAGELTPNLKLRRSAIETIHAGLIEELYHQADATRTARGSTLPVVTAPSAGQRRPDAPRP